MSDSRLVAPWTSPPLPAHQQLRYDAAGPRRPSVGGFDENDARSRPRSLAVPVAGGALLGCSGGGGTPDASTARRGRNRDGGRGGRRPGRVGGGWRRRRRGTAVAAASGGRRHRRRGGRQRRRPAPSARRAPAGRVAAAGGSAAAAVARAARPAEPPVAAARRGGGRHRPGGSGRRDRRQRGALDLPVGVVHGAQSVEHHADEGGRRAAVRRLQQQRQQLRKHRGRDCWFGDALYVSEIASDTNPPRARILRVPPTGARVDRLRHVGIERPRHRPDGAADRRQPHRGRRPRVQPHQHDVDADRVGLHGQAPQHAQRSHRAQRRDDLLHRPRLPGAEPAPAGDDPRLPPAARRDGADGRRRGAIEPERHHAVARRGVPVRHRRPGPVALSGQRRRQHRNRDAHRAERGARAATAWESTAPATSTSRRAAGSTCQPDRHGHVAGLDHRTAPRASPTSPSAARTTRRST